MIHEQLQSVISGIKTGMSSIPLALADPNKPPKSGSYYIDYQQAAQDVVGNWIVDVVVMALVSDADMGKMYDVLEAQPEKWSVSREDKGDHQWITASAEIRTKSI